MVLVGYLGAPLIPPHLACRASWSEPPPHVLKLWRRLELLPGVIEQSTPKKKAAQCGWVPSERKRAVQMLLGIFRQQTGLPEVIPALPALLEG